MLPVCRVTADHPYLEARDFVDSGRIHHMDSKSNMLHGLYNMVYMEYSHFKSVSRYLISLSTTFKYVSYVYI